MVAFSRELNRFLLLIVLAGGAAPLAAWLLSGVFKRLLRRLYPPESAAASVVSKRIEVKTKDSNHKTYTIYFATFQSSDGSRAEYELPATAYAMAALGDHGVLSLHMGKFAGFMVTQGALL